MTTVLFLFLVSTVLITISAREDKLKKNEQGFGDFEKFIDMCTKTEEPKKQNITAMTTACGNYAYIFTETHVFTFFEYTEYDSNTTSFLRFQSMDRVKKVFSSSLNVVSATFIGNGFIALKENETGLWHIYDCWDGPYRYKHYSETLEENIAAVSNFTKMAKNTKYSNFSIRSIIGFMGRTGKQFTKITACLDLTNKCIQYDEIYHQHSIIEIDASEKHELIYYEDSVGFYSFIAKETGTMFRKIYYKDSAAIRNIIFAEKGMFFGCPPLFCDGVFVDALLKKSSYDVDLFYGQWFLHWNFTTAPTKAQHYKSHWCKNMFKFVDAAFHDTNNQNVYFFKENNIILCEYAVQDEWKLNQNLMLSIFGNKIMRVDAAFYLSGYNSTGQVFLFHNDTLSIYKLQSSGHLTLVSEKPVKQFMSELDSYIDAAVTGWVNEREQVIVVRRGLVFVGDILQYRGNLTDATTVMPFPDFTGCPKQVTSEITASMPKTIKGITPKIDVSTITLTSQETETHVTTTFSKYIGLVLPFLLVLGIMFFSLIAYPFVVLCGYYKEKPKTKKGKRGKKGYAFPAKPLPKSFFRDLERQMGLRFKKDTSNEANKSENEVENKLQEISESETVE